LSLKAVEAATSGELGATALSGYERGEHAITVRRLYLLSTIYGVPVDDLIASSGAGPKQSEPPLNRANRPTPVRLDLDRLDQATGREAQMVRRLVGQIKGWRAPQARESIELRQGDLDTAAALLDESVENLVACLRDSGVLRKRRGRPPKGP
jgi:transcriptional regulator with XRE-family HTH domain